MRDSRRIAAAGVLLAFLLATVQSGAATTKPAAPVFGKAVGLVGSAGGTEPRVAIGPDDRRWVITNDKASGNATVFVSSNKGKSWKRTAAEPAGQHVATIDVDVVTTRTGRIIATELDFAGINFPTSYSDDGGKTWTASTGTTLVDQDRQWLAVGPDDASTHQPRVYLLYHNLLSGAGNHNMFVMTSKDGGATFGPPIPTTLPGDQAYLDLQCADSGGPGGLSVNPKTGQLYAFFGTRSSQAGGCAAQPIEANIVAATRVWVATSRDGSVGSWTQSLATDNSASGRIVGMQVELGALDKKGNVYVTYPESPRAYPDYTGGAIIVKWAPADLSTWSKPIVMARGGGAGNLIPHIVAGDPGKIDVAYFAGVLRKGIPPLWYTTVAQTLNAFSAKPVVTQTRLARLPSYSGTANQMMGACGTGPLQGIQNGFACNRSTDVWGVALDSRCLLTVTWPSVVTDVSSTPATWVATQTAGPSLCASAKPKAKKSSGKSLR